MGKLFFVGDMHGGFSGDQLKLSRKQWPVQDSLNKEDVVIQMGDFGYVWYHSLHPKRKADDHYLDSLSKAKFTFAFVDGNHENFDLLEEFPEVQMWGNTVREIRPGVYHLKRGHVYTINGKTVFVFGGAQSDPNQIEYNFIGKGKNRKEKKQKSWWPQEMCSLEEMDTAWENLKLVNYKVDYILTHTTASIIIEDMFEDSYRAEDPLSIFLNLIRRRVKFSKWIFGHFHEDKKYIDIYNKLSENPIFYCVYHKIIDFEKERNSE